VIAIFKGNGAGFGWILESTRGFAALHAAAGPVNLYLLKK